MKALRRRVIWVGAFSLVLIVALAGCNLAEWRQLLTPTPVPDSEDDGADSDDRDFTATPVGVATDAPTAVPTSEDGAAPVFTATPTTVPSPVPTDVPTIVPTAVPTAVPTPVPTAVETGLSVFGYVYWVNDAQVGVRVELRECSNFTTCPLLAEVYTDGSGRYEFASPPVTATQVFIYYPTTGEYSSTWISPVAFTIPVGGTVDVGTTYLVKDMDLIAPANDAAVGRRVLLQWEDLPDVVQYRVMVFREDTGVQLADEYTSKTELYVSLPPGLRCYWWVWGYVDMGKPPGYSSDREWWYFNVSP